MLLSHRRSFVFLIFNLLFFSASVVAGTLDPPPGPPASTMRTLDEVGSWSQTLSGASRFSVVLNGQAALDKETGLVWELSPEQNVVGTLAEAQIQCYTLKKGGRKGWRLPTVSELTSLFGEQNGQTKLPNGHPFTFSSQVQYYTETTYTNIYNLNDSSYVYVVNMGNGNTSYKSKIQDSAYYWCVRGGEGR